MKDLRHWDEEILTSREARGLLKIGRTKLWELTATESIPAYRLGEGKTAALRYKRSDLMNWLERHRYASERDGMKEKREETV
ncbi:MAG: helix-turn-helix domain-containing protein [Acidobacteriia bacterium]|nr:helix-turn-helix domain-containing protein [Terriglobia bacterium]